tara:strand:+ start:755 stop:1006 length:252 start_codon:yes stop_codon:yes gene_type:complete
MSLTKLKSLKQISEESGVIPVSTLRNWAQQGIYPAFKMGKKWVVKEEDHNLFIEKYKEKGAVLTQTPKSFRNFDPSSERGFYG